MSVAVFNDLTVFNNALLNNMVTDTAQVNSLLVNDLLFNGTFSTNSLSPATGDTMSLNAKNVIIGNDNTNGNIILLGNVSYVQSQELQVKDPLITLNKGGIISTNSGLEVEDSGNIVQSIRTYATAGTRAQGFSLSGNTQVSNISILGNVLSDLRIRGNCSVFGNLGVNNGFIANVFGFNVFGIVGNISTITTNILNGNVSGNVSGENITSNILNTVNANISGNLIMSGNTSTSVINNNGNITTGNLRVINEVLTGNIRGVNTITNKTRINLYTDEFNYNNNAGELDLRAGNVFLTARHTANIGGDDITNLKTNSLRTTSNTIKINRDNNNRISGIKFFGNVGSSHNDLKSMSILTNDEMTQLNINGNIHFTGNILNTTNFNNINASNITSNITTSNIINSNTVNFNLCNSNILTSNIGNISICNSNNINNSGNITTGNLLTNNIIVCKEIYGNIYGNLFASFSANLNNQQVITNNLIANVATINNEISVPIANITSRIFSPSANITSGNIINVNSTIINNRGNLTSNIISANLMTIQNDLFVNGFINGSLIGDVQSLNIESDNANITTLNSNYIDTNTLQAGNIFCSGILDATSIIGRLTSTRIDITGRGNISGVGNISVLGNANINGNLICNEIYKFNPTGTDNQPIIINGSNVADSTVNGAINSVFKLLAMGRARNLYIAEDSVNSDYFYMGQDGGGGNDPDFYIRGNRTNRQLCVGDTSNDTNTENLVVNGSSNLSGNITMGTNNSFTTLFGNVFYHEPQIYKTIGGDRTLTLTDNSSSIKFTLRRIIDPSTTISLFGWNFSTAGSYITGTFNIFILAFGSNSNMGSYSHFLRMGGFCKTTGTVMAGGSNSFVGVGTATVTPSAITIGTPTYSGLLATDVTGLNQMRINVPISTGTPLYLEVILEGTITHCDNDSQGGGLTTVYLYS